MANSTTAEHAVIRKDISRFKWTMMQMKRYKVAYLMVAPFFLLFFLRQYMLLNWDHKLIRINFFIFSGFYINSDFFQFFCPCFPGSKIIFSVIEIPFSVK